MQTVCLHKLNETFFCVSDSNFYLLNYFQFPLRSTCSTWSGTDPHTHTHTHFTEQMSEILQNSVICIYSRFAFARLIHIVRASTIGMHTENTTSNQSRDDEKDKNKNTLMTNTWKVAGTRSIYGICLDECKFKLNRRRTNLMINKHNAKGKWSETTRLKIVYTEI